MIIADEEMKDIMRKVKYLKEIGLWKWGISEIKNEAKKQKERFLGMLIGSLGASLLKNLSPDKKILCLK